MHSALPGSSLLEARPKLGLGCIDHGCCILMMHVDVKPEATAAQGLAEVLRHILQKFILFVTISKRPDFFSSCLQCPLNQYFQCGLWHLTSTGQFASHWYHCSIFSVSVTSFLVILVAILKLPVANLTTTSSHSKVYIYIYINIY